jgi:hypothetical protein
VSLEKLSQQRKQVIVITSDAGVLKINANGNLTPAEVSFALDLYKDQIKRNVIQGGGNILVPGMLTSDLKRVPAS